jgi:hypothetical protein
MCVECFNPLGHSNMAVAHEFALVSSAGETRVHRIESSDNILDVMERIVGRGIVVDPWASMCLAEPERLRRYRWVVDGAVHEGTRDLRKAT